MSFATRIGAMNIVRAMAFLNLLSPGGLRKPLVETAQRLLIRRRCLDEGFPPCTRAIPAAPNVDFSGGSADARIVGPAHAVGMMPMCGMGAGRHGSIVSSVNNGISADERVCFGSRACFHPEEPARQRMKRAARKRRTSSAVARNSVACGDTTQAMDGLRRQDQCTGCTLIYYGWNS